VGAIWLREESGARYSGRPSVRQGENGADPSRKQDRRNSRGKKIWTTAALLGSTQNRRFRCAAGRAGARRREAKKIEPGPDLAERNRATAAQFAGELNQKRTTAPRLREEHEHGRRRISEEDANREKTPGADTKKTATEENQHSDGGVLRESSGAANPSAQRANRQRRRGAGVDETHSPSARKKRQNWAGPLSRD
jgi:hypothetical protein